MEALGPKELRTALAFLQGLYADRDLKGFQAHTVAALARLVPAEISAWSEVNPRLRRQEVVSLPDVPAEYPPAHKRHMGDHPLIAHYHRTGDGRALKISIFSPGCCGTASASTTNSSGRSGWNISWPLQYPAQVLL